MLVWPGACPGQISLAHRHNGPGSPGPLKAPGEGHPELPQWQSEMLGAFPRVKWMFTFSVSVQKSTWHDVIIYRNFLLDKGIIKRLLLAKTVVHLKFGGADSPNSRCS